ncbi:MAG TPA: molybdenum cofactor biosynthesis protein MoaE [Actinomycetota bacterium]|nr:molybdenum cofactor biosynthesis protein MoaE [Actinomycetota bacterium]
MAEIDTAMSSEPPVAEIDTAISSEPLDTGAIIGRAGTIETGGIGVFVGTVRATPSAGGRANATVTHLDYEAHPTLAEQRLRELAGEAAEKWGLQRVVAVHRTGRCEVGEPTVVLACSAPHRAEALDACRWLIDEIKRDVPIWKKEHYSHGSAWI